MFKLSALVVVALLFLQGVALADPPLFERDTRFDADVRLNGASNFCGFEIRGHFTGSSNFTLFYDKDGNIIREIDTFPALKATIYRPGTNLSYSSVSPQVVTFHYTDGAALGSAVTIVATGLLEKIPGVGMDTGRAVFTGIVVDYDAAGVPLVRTTGLVSSSGQDFPIEPVGRARCAFFQQ